MFNAIYENEKGRLNFSGGGRGDLLLTAVSGLGLPRKEVAVAGYAERAGQELLWARDTSRTITLAFDLMAKEGAAALGRVLGILYIPGVLTVTAGGRSRKISCRTETVEEPEKRAPGLYSVVAQLVCDTPYFTDVSPQNEPLFYREDLIESGFSLPCIFTERRDGKSVRNAGDVPTQPVFTVTNTGKEESTGTEQGIRITHRGTGKSLHLDYVTAPGESLLIDLPARRITSSTQGDVTGCLGAGCYLSDFWLLPGENPLQAESLRAGEQLTVGISYDNLYLEAVM
ncbi:MAG: phage tail family protein [Clostridia bacterium]|nr:phage tail family protein [Clostridia bacterium]